jgi:hypothetical protein
MGEVGPALTEAAELWLDAELSSEEFFELEWKRARDLAADNFDRLIGLRRQPDGRR